MQEKALHQDLQGLSVCLSYADLSVCFSGVCPLSTPLPPHTHPHLFPTPILTFHPHSSVPSTFPRFAHPLPIPTSTPSQVIPLSQRSGIVEWCEETRPLGEYLIGPPQSPHQGAHYRYRPSDSSSMECRKKLTVGVAH